MTARSRSNQSVEYGIYRTSLYSLMIYILVRGTHLVSGSQKILEIAEHFVWYVIGILDPDPNSLHVDPSS